MGFLLLAANTSSLMLWSILGDQGGFTWESDISRTPKGWLGIKLLMIWDSKVPGRQNKQAYLNALDQEGTWHVWELRSQSICAQDQSRCSASWTPGSRIHPWIDDLTFSLWWMVTSWLPLLCTLSRKSQAPALSTSSFPQLTESTGFLFIFMDGPTCGKRIPCLHVATGSSDTEVIRIFSEVSPF